MKMIVVTNEEMVLVYEGENALEKVEKLKEEAEQKKIETLELKPLDG